MKTAIRQKKRKRWRFWLTLLMLTVWMVPCAQAEMAEQSAPLAKDKVVRVASPMEWLWTISMKSPNIQAGNMSI